MKKIVSILLTVCLLVTSVTTVVAASENDVEELNIDGFEIQVVEDNDGETVVKTIVDGVEYELEFDKEAEDYEMTTKEYSATIFGIGIGFCEEENFTIEVDNMNEDFVEADIISEETNEITHIDESMVEAQAAVLKSGGSVFATSSGYAYDACKSASPIGKVSDKQKHSGGGKNYYHYHPMIKAKQQSKAHCWFL